MTKDGHGSVQPLLYALREDYVKWYPELSQYLYDEFDRIGKLVKTRGIRVVMIDFPDTCKVLDKGLSSGWLNFHKIPKVIGSWEKETLVLYKLFRLAFDEDGRLLDPDSTLVFFLRQFLLMWKKVRKEPTDATIEAAVDEFHFIEKGLRYPAYRWDRDGLGENYPRLDWELTGLFEDSGGSRVPRRLIDAVRSTSERLISLFPEVLLQDLFPRHGPGAVADLGSKEDKYLFPHWSRKLDSFFYVEYLTRIDDDHEKAYSSVFDAWEPPAKLLAVPKTLKAPRLIASEPTANQWCQQALLQWIRRFLPRPLAASIDFLSQEPSKKLALQASENGFLATVDLSSASDRLSCWVVERVFGSNQSLLQGLMHARTSRIKSGMPRHKFQEYKLKKFAAQGAAITFPVQTIVYAICCYAAELYELGLSPSLKNIQRVASNVRVFGDDIILPSRSVQSLTLLLEYFQLKVNVGKTHWQGHFRESCGMDAWKGTSVNPCYLSDLTLGGSLQDLASWLEIRNNFYKHGLWSVAKEMDEMIPSKWRGFIPTSREDLGVLRRFTYLRDSSYPKLRYNIRLHRDETLGFRVSVREYRRRRNSYTDLLQYFTERPPATVKWDAGFVRGRHLSVKRCWVPTA
jgi:hypothetical protein